MSVFGPALLLCALAVTWPVFESAASRLFAARIGARLAWAAALSPWLRSLGLPYAALMLGAVAARDMGLYGQSLLEIVLGLGVTFGLAVLNWRLRPAQDWPNAALDAQDEVRWALYRALGWGWSGSLMVGLLAGLVAALLERVLSRMSAGGPLHRQPEDVGWLLRVASSAALFGLAHNLWFNLLSHLAFPAGRALWRWQRRPPAGSPS
jgi:hypothetical protein